MSIRFFIEKGQEAGSVKPLLSISSIYAELFANAALVWIGVAVALPDCQIVTQANALETEGGFTERIY